MSIDIGQVKTICVLGWGLKGDLFIRIPVIEALKKQYPDAEISVIVDPNNVDVLSNHPDVAEVFPFSRNKKPLLKYLAGAMVSIRRLRRHGFDLSVNLYSGGSSPLIMKLINARVRLGFDHSRALRRSNNLLARHPSFCQHWTTAFAAVLEPLGIDAASVRRGTSYYCRDESKQYAQGLLQPYGDAEFIALNLGAGSADKRWPIDRFVALARQASSRYGMVPVVFTNPGMESLAAQFAQAYAPYGEVLHLPRIPLDQEAAIMERCSVMVTGDTALLHIASGLKCPILALFTHTRPEAVEPEDCPFVACYTERADSVDECGRPVVNTELPVEVVLDGLARLMRQLDTDEKVI